MQGFGFSNEGAQNVRRQGFGLRSKSVKRILCTRHQDFVPAGKLEHAAQSRPWTLGLPAY